MAPIVAQTLIPRRIPITPTAERWQAMTQAAREQFMVEVNVALSDPRIVMAEGRPHKKAKSRARAKREVETAKREVEGARFGMRRAIVAFLATRGVSCSADGLARLDACTESKQLERWLHRALLAASEVELFSEE